MQKRDWNIQELISVIRSIAIKELLPRFSKVKERKKMDGSLLTEADITVQTQIQDYLTELDSDILFLGEEMTADEQEKTLNLNNKAVWVLDPLDGTTNFVSGIPYYAVSLALIEQGKVVLGIVYDPERDECFVAEKDRGATLNGNRIELANNPLELKNAVACIDLKRLPANLASKIVTQHPFRSQRSFGGVALDWCWLAAGRFDVYLHGKQNIWDYAAGHLVFSETGGISSTLEGAPIFESSLTPRSGIGAINPNLFLEWSEWLKI